MNLRQYICNFSLIVFIITFLGIIYLFSNNNDMGNRISAFQYNHKMSNATNNTNTHRRCKNVIITKNTVISEQDNDFHEEGIKIIDITIANSARNPRQLTYHYFVIYPQEIYYRKTRIHRTRSSMGRQYSKKKQKKDYTVILKYIYAHFRKYDSIVMKEDDFSDCLPFEWIKEILGNYDYKNRLIYYGYGFSGINIPLNMFPKILAVWANSSQPVDVDLHKFNITHLQPVLHVHDSDSRVESLETLHCDMYCYSFCADTHTERTTYENIDTKLLPHLVKLDRSKCKFACNEHVHARIKDFSCCRNKNSFANCTRT